MAGNGRGPEDLSQRTLGSSQLSGLSQSPANHRHVSHSNLAPILPGGPEWQPIYGTPHYIILSRTMREAMNLYADKAEQLTDLHVQVKEKAMRLPFSAENFKQLASLLITNLNHVLGEERYKPIHKYFQHLLAHNQKQGAAQGQGQVPPQQPPFNAPTMVAPRPQQHTIANPMQQPGGLLNQQQHPQLQQHQLPMMLHQTPGVIHVSQPNLDPKQQGDPSGPSKPPKAQKAGAKRAADGDPDGGGAPKAPKRAKGGGGQRKKKAQESDMDNGDAGDKIMFGGEVIDLQAETDAAVDTLDRRRHQQVTTLSDVRAWDSGYQYLSAWRLTNEILIQRKEKMQSGGASASASVVDVVTPDMLRAIQLGFTGHSARVLQRAAQAAKHRAASFAAQRRAEFVSTGEDARRGVGEIRRAAEKVAADRAAAEREELMKKAQSKRADEDTRERAQKAKAEMAGQQQEAAANKALAATIGGATAKWSKWGGGGIGKDSSAQTKKAAAAAASAGGESGPEPVVEGGVGESGAGGLTSSKSRANLGGGGGGWGGKESEGGNESADVQLQDLIVALQQDPMYCKSTLLYRLLNGMT